MSDTLVNKVGDKTLDVVLVGCGMPKRGMGWYHLTQLLEMENANVIGMVEPFFLNPTLCPTPPAAFTELVTQLEAAACGGVVCTDSVSKLATFEEKDTMCLIAGRTNDNPKLFKECVDQGAKVIYLEKPGAPTVAELQEMSDLAESKGVKVYLGYNKNVTPYVQKALALQKENAGSSITFCHNNSYATNELNECFTRNREGMLKNMAIHELALLVSFFGVTVDTVKDFNLNTHTLFTEKLSVWVPGTVVPNDEYISDFSRIGFSVTTKDSDNSVSVMADRCGGNVSFASVKNADGVEIEKFNFPDEETLKKVEKQCEEDPEMMPYFFVQSDDYSTLKNLVVDSALSGEPAQSVATIQIAIEALKLAEYFTEEAGRVLDAIAKEEKEKAEKNRLAEIEAEQKAKEEAEAKKKEEEEAAHKKHDKEAAKVKAEEELEEARLQMEVKKKTRLRAIEEAEAVAAKKKAEEEATAAKKIEEEAAAAAQKKAEEEAIAAKQKADDEAAVTATRFRLDRKWFLSQVQAEEEAATAKQKVDEKAAAAKKKVDEEAASATRKVLFPTAESEKVEPSPSSTPAPALASTTTFAMKQRAFDFANFVGGAVAATAVMYTIQNFMPSN
uniref:Gfo/Idh/MocA-like oxidoreductase N-terminal domain-containing protein n=1 Tax=Chaetoceros debilis TaxID=122233 RepID=A0A7S3VEF7_9STRA